MLDYINLLYKVLCSFLSMYPICNHSSIIFIPLLKSSDDVLPDLREPIIISNLFNNSVGSL